jgi:hypothetical protein
MKDMRMKRITKKKGDLKKVGILFLIFLFSIIFALSFEEIIQPKTSKDKPEIKADLWPTISIYASSNEVNTTVTITAIANDYGNNAGLLWIKIYENNTLIAEKDCQQQTTCSLVKVVMHNNPGYYQYYAKTKDLGGHEKESERIYVKFNGFNQPPQIINYTPENLTPSVYENSSLYFEVIAYDPNNDPLTYEFLLDEQKVSNTNNFLYKPGFFDSGYHEVLAIVKDNKGGVATKRWNVTVINVLIPVTCSLSFNPESPIVYGQMLKAYCSCNNPEAQTEMWRDGVNVTNEIGLPVLLAAKPSGYLYICNVSETQNYANASTEALYIIHKANHTAHLALNGVEANVEVVYPTLINATGWLEINQATNNAVLLRNGSVVAIGSPATEIVLLPVGVYNYTYYYPESQNYSEAKITRLLRVKQNQTILSLNAYPSWQVVYGTPVNVSCSANNNEVLLGLYRNNSLVASGYGLVYDYIDAYELAAGDYEYVCNTSGNGNYSSASISNVLKINKAQTILSLNAYPSWQVIYGTQTNVSCSANHNQATLNLYRNNMPVENPDIAILAAGNYAYTCNMSESQNYTQASINNVLIVNKKNATVNLLLNGFDGDITVNISQVVVAEGYLYLDQGSIPQPVPQPPSLPFKSEKEGFENEKNTRSTNIELVQGPFTIYLYIDGKVVANGDYSLNYTTSFNQSQTGIHNFTLYFHGNENYTEAYETHFVTVLPDTQSPNVTIYSPLNQTYTTNLVDLNYSVEDNIVIDSCWYSLNDQNHSLENCQNTTLSLDNGFYHLIVYANDTSGNIGYDDVYFTIFYDSISPTINIESPLNQTYTNNYVWINISANDNVAVDKIWYRIDGDQNISYTAPILQYFDDGQHLLEAWANDTSNNIAYAYVYFTISLNNPPSVVLLSPENGSIDEDGNVTIEYAISDDTALFLVCDVYSNVSGTWQIDVSQNVMNGSINNYSYINLDNGIYIWNVACNDSFNYAFAPYNFTFIVNKTFDNIPPTITFIPPTPQNGSVLSQNWVYINASVVDNVAVDSCLVEWNGVNQSMIKEGLANAICYINISNLADGIYSFKVFANDTSGNINVSEERMVTINTSLNNPPYVQLIQPENGEIINNTSLNLSFYVSDDNASLLDCYLYTNISGEWQQTDYKQANNNTTNNFTLNYLENGIYVWNVECSDGLLSSFADENWTFIINVTHDVGIDDSYSSSINGIRIIDNETGEIIMDDPAKLIYGKNYTVRARVKNYGQYPENVNIVIKIINSTHEFIISNYTTTINQWHYSQATFNTSSYAIGSYYVLINATLLNYADQNLSNNERNRSFDIIIDTPPYWLNENVTPPSPSTYESGPYNFSIEWYDNINVTQVIFEFNNTNYSTQCFPSLPTNATKCYYVFNTLAAGSYGYRWYAKDIGLWNSTPTLSYIINKAQTQLSLNAYPSWQVVYGTPVNVSCSANNNEVLLGLYRNNSLVASGYGLVYDYSTLPVGNYEYICNTSGSQNYTQANVSNILVVTELLPGEVRLWIDGVEGNVTKNYANENIKINASGYGNVSIYRNGTLIAWAMGYVEVYQNLPAGIYNFTAYSTGDANHSSASITYFLTINKANSSLRLYLNGVEGDIGVIEGENVNITAILEIPTIGNISLLENGTLIAYGLSPLTKIKSYPIGYYNITAIYLGNENYTSSIATHFIKAQAAIHDIGVDELWQIKANGRDNRTIYLNDLLNISAKITNYGNVNESNVIINFTDTYVVNGTPVTIEIDTKNISLSSGESKIVSFSYVSLPKGVHTLKIKAIVANDVNPSNDFNTLDLVVWSVNDVVSNDTREIFINNTNPHLNEIFAVYLPIQNALANQDFYDFPALLIIQPNNLTPLEPVQNYSYLPAGGFIVVQWHVNATTPGLYDIGAIEGVNELIIPSKKVNVTG